VPLLQKLRHTCKIAEQFSCGKLGKTRRTWKHAPHLRKCGTLRKMLNTWKDAAHLEKYGILEKFRRT